MIEILSSMPLATVQDLGRDRHFRYGVSACGALDRLALAVGNTLLGNSVDAAGIEIPLFPFQVRFRTDVVFAATGADCNADLDGTPVLPWWAMPAGRGQILSLQVPTSGMRCYLTVRGGIDVPIVLGSRSTQLRGAFGGHEGRTLQKGDVLPIIGVAEHRAIQHDFPLAGFGVDPPGSVLEPIELAPHENDTVTTLRVLPAAEYDHFDRASQDVFWNTDWRITSQSSRAGYRLAGPNLSTTEPIEMRSHGLVPGVIQLPSGGMPIIQVADSQTSGGYPKIATVIEADLWRLGQARLGTDLRFVETTYQQALEATDTVNAYLDKVRNLADAFRRSGGSFRSKSDKV